MAASNETLGDRMKGYEAIHDGKIPPYLPFIVRLDGKNFSKFTSGFRKPFDDLFVIAMIRTMNDLVVKFNPKTGYTHSDEISLIFSASCTKEEYDTKTNKSTHLLDGRVLKLCSILASYCGVRFNYHMTQLLQTLKSKEQYKEHFITKIMSCEACFDARVLEFPYDKPYELVNHMIWRSVNDCHRNAVSAYGYVHLKKSQMHKKHSDDIIKMLKEQVGVDWATDVPNYIKHGVFCKKELVQKEVEDTGLGKTIVVTRQRIKNVSFKISYSDDMLRFLLDKNFLENTDFIKPLFTVDVTTDIEDGSTKITEL